MANILGGVSPSKRNNNLGQRELSQKPTHQLEQIILQQKSEIDKLHRDNKKILQDNEQMKRMMVQIMKKQ
jgi:hypothetical protein